MEDLSVVRVEKPMPPNVVQITTLSGLTSSDYQKNVTLAIVEDVVA